MAHCRCISAVRFRELSTCWANRRCWRFCCRRSPGCRDWFCSSCRPVLQGRVGRGSNLWIAGSLFVSSLIWIAILSLLAMALSAWVKWRIVAGALLLGVMFFGAGFGQAINAVMRTESGNFFNLAYLMGTVWNALFQVDAEHAIPVAQAWVALLVYCAICLGLLMRKVRAYEVIR